MRVAAIRPHAGHHTEHLAEHEHRPLQTLHQAGIPYQVVGEFGSLEAIKQCVIGGLGIAYLPWITVQKEVAQRTLHAIPYTDTDDHYTQVVYLKRRWQFPPLQHLLDLIGVQKLSD